MRRLLSSIILRSVSWFTTEDCESRCATGDGRNDAKGLRLDKDKGYRARLEGSLLES